MTKQDRQGRLIAGAVFVSLFFIWGSGYETFPIFFPALLKYFGWSKARLGLMSTGFSAGFVPSVLVAGWLLDRIEARWVMGTGAMLVVAGLVLASRSGSFSTLLAANVIIGVGLGAATFVPAALVIANWFDERLGLVLGLTLSGMEVGGTGMVLLSERIITMYGWRAAYFTLACLIFMISLPSILIFVRTRPKSTGAIQSVAESAQALPGLEVREAFCTRAFWMLIIAEFCYGLAIAGTFVHLAEYLLGVGYGLFVTTVVIAAALGMQAVGRPIIGSVGDRLGSRNALVFSLVCLAIATVLLLYVHHRPWLLLIYVVMAGLNGAAPVTVIPMVQAETLGLKRFGSIGGLLGVAGPAGVAIGPVLVGWIADAHSYAGGFELCAMSFVAAAGASFLCDGPLQEQGLAIETARQPAPL